MQKIFTKEEIINKAIDCYKKEGQIDLPKLVSELGINVYYKNDLLNYWDSNFNANIVKNKDKYEIYVNRSHPITRQRFSVAHELAHYLLHKEKIDANGEMTRNGDGKIETEADNLAAEILMPELLVKEYLAQKGYQNGFDINKVKEIADNFKVSPVVSIIRLRNLNYNVPFIEFA